MALPHVLLEFENQIILDFFNENGFLVMCEGLGLQRTLLHFLHLYCDVNELLFVLNTDQFQQNYYIEKLKLSGVTRLPKPVTSEYSANERKILYAEGGVFFASSRILVMDMLVDRIPVHLVSGLLVNDAHKMADACQENFILRLFRQKNKSGFIKAFTDNPVALVGGYGRLEKALKNLFCKEVFLYPRFHSSILSCLEKHQPEVVEIEVEMTSSMKLVQNSLLEIVAACLRELKSNNPGIDTDNFTLENSLGRAFDRSVRLQLDPIWNQLSSKTKHLVSDLRLLRLLLRALSQYDCVTFLKMLESSSGSEKAFGKNPGWIFLDASDSLFSSARHRVYGKKSAAENRAAAEAELLLEESPKWEVLKQCLCEILETNKATSATELGKGKVLVCASDMRAAHILKDILSHGSRAGLVSLYNRVFNKNVKVPCRSSSDGPCQQSEQAENWSTSDRSGSLKNKVLENPETYLYALYSNPDPYGFTKILDELQPRYVILNDFSIQFVRQLEIFKASHPGVPLRVYFLTYKSSAEEQVYLTALRREKEAFQTLIQEKSKMVVPTEREGRTDDDPNLERTVESAHQVNSRKAGGQKESIETKQLVVVDMREFRSELPASLYKRGVDIEPLTIEVGDYILTPDICVERKSLSDLIGSLNSGRLYLQCTAMCRHYKQPMLLIEFDATKAFSFRSRGVAGGIVSLKDLNQKLALLLLHFPKLRLAWCSSPSASAQLFHELKVSRQQPDPANAAAVVELGRSSEQTYNPSPHDLLLKLPGIDSKNCRRILHHVKNLKELCLLTKSQLSSLLDSASNADSLHTFLHKVSEVEKSSSHFEKPRSKIKRPFSTLPSKNNDLFGKTKKSLPS